MNGRPNHDISIDPSSYDRSYSITSGPVSYGTSVGYRPIIILRAYTLRAYKNIAYSSV